MEGGVATGEVVLDQLAKIAVMVLIGNVLPGREIELGLIEPASQALSILGNKPGDESAGDDGGDQQ